MSVKDQIRTKRTELQTLTNQAKTLAAELEQKADGGTQEESNKLNALVADGMKKRGELETLLKLDANDELVNTPAGEKQAQEAPPTKRGRKSWGLQVVESKQRQAALEKGQYLLESVPLESNIRQLKTVVNLFTTTQSIEEPILFDMDRQIGVVDVARQQPPTILDLINIVRTTAGAVEYVRMTARQNLAAVVPESSSGSGGLKPQSDITFDLQTALMKTIATWIAASRQILSDAPMLQDTINGELIYDVMRILEDEILNGDGTGNHFTGILATSGIATRVMSLTTPSGRGQTTDDNKIDTLRRACTDIYLAFYEPTGIVVAPADGEALELAKDDQGRYLKEYDSVTKRLWRVPVVESPAMTAGTSLVGNFKLAVTLYDREEANVRISENVNDDFIRNMVRLLGEVRAGLAVPRPLALEKVTLI